MINPLKQGDGMTGKKWNLVPSGEQLRAMYERMLLIRRMEERLCTDFAEGKLPGAVHLYIGQEAVAVGVCNHLRDEDWITSTHRGHGHFLAKGGDPRAMMAEIWGKKNGICKGMGGSMHVADISKGILGANGIVGGGFAIATGAAFGSKLAGDGRVTVAFFGDGAANQGVFMETLNVSTLWRLPLVYICEYNHFCEFTPTAQVTSGRIADRARAFGVPCAVVDGNDAVEVWKAAGDAIERARNGEGPQFVEATTYRIRGHLEAEELFLQGGQYREITEIDEWRKRCPIDRLKRRLIADGVCDEDELDSVDRRTLRVIEEAAAYSEAGEPADTRLVFDLMHVGQRA
jgi:pyruvate dehydrogenase E1 component alpha subunit